MSHEAYRYPQSPQPSLFGMLSQSDPLSSRTPAPEIEKRHRARSRAFAKASPVVMARYRACLMEVGRLYPVFGAWAVTETYVGKYGALETTERKALGGLFTELLETGVIEEAGFGKRPNGNVAAIYKLLRSEDANS